MVIISTILDPPKTGDARKMVVLVEILEDKCCPKRGQGQAPGIRIWWGLIECSAQVANVPCGGMGNGEYFMGGELFQRLSPSWASEASRRSW